MLSVDEALSAVLACVSPLEAEEVELRHAVGRVLASPIVADLDDPAFDRSAMDGYALRAADASVAPAELRVTGVIAAGDPPPERPLGNGEAMRIMTGAPLPPGADSVQMVEVCERVGEGTAERVVVREAVRLGSHIRYRAEVVSRGDEAARAGRVITPELVGVMASFGAARVAVHRRPTVWVAATGDELVAVDQVPGPGQIRDSNRWTVAAIAGREGAAVTVAERLRDDSQAMREGIAAGLDHDILVLSGGVSMGEFDVVGAALESLGVEILFHKVAIQPGKPIMVGRRGKTLVFGLPGNPVSVLVTARVFLSPALRRLAGHARVTDPLLPARLDGRLGQARDRTVFHPAIVSFGSDGPVVRPLDTKGSADQVAHARRNCFIVRPRGSGPFESGATVACSVDALSLYDVGG